MLCLPLTRRLAPRIELRLRGLLPLRVSQNFTHHQRSLLLRRSAFPRDGGFGERARVPAPVLRSPSGSAALGTPFG